MEFLNSGLLGAITAWNLVDITVGWMYFLFAVACFVVAVTALIKCLPKDAGRFIAENKRTKGFWMGMTGGACLLSLLGVMGIGPFALLFPVAGAVMASVYLADVNPEVS